jgi:hypothetical protein
MVGKNASSNGNCTGGASTCRRQPLLSNFATAMIALGLGLTVAWVALLGYGLVTIIEFAPSGWGAVAVVAIAVCVCMVALSFLPPKAVTPGFRLGGTTEHNRLGRGETQRFYPTL